MPEERAPIWRCFPAHPFSSPSSPSRAIPCERTPSISRPLAREAAALPPSSSKVGPRSAGAEPGPACYDRGGSEPTLT
ncbi:MAG: hypothetical protein E6G96_17330, partial [Alphaproteobacteria bacterium]